YADIGQFETAAEWLKKSIANSTPQESHLRKAYALLVNCLIQIGYSTEAMEQCLSGLRYFPLDAELRFRHGMLAHVQGDLTGAVQSYRSILEISEQRHFSSIDPAIRGFKTRHN